MRITAKEWNAYKKALAAINAKASAEIQTAKIDFDVNPDDAKRFVETIARKYGDAAAELSCQMFEATALKQGVKKVVAEPINDIRESGIVRIIKETDGDIVKLSQRVGILVKKQASKTTLYNARRYGCEVAWIPSGDACAFCLMLASNGWRTGRRKYDSDNEIHAHANCECEYAVRFDDSLDVAGYDPESIKDEFPDGGSWQDKMNALRRENYAENKDAINAQKREAYAKRNNNNEN